MRSNNKQRGKSKKRNKRARMNGNRWSPKNNSLQLTTMTTLIPNELDAILEFTYSNTIQNNTGAYYARRYTPNCPYDVDPLVASTSTPGFAEYATFYNMCRAIEYKYTIDVINKETFPILCVVQNTNIDPGASSDYGPYMGNPRVQSALISGSAGGPCRHVFRGRHTVAEIVGSRMVENDDSFASLTNAVPVNKVWTGIGINGIGNNVPNGVLVLVKFWIYVRFYERKALST